MLNILNYTINSAGPDNRSGSIHIIVDILQLYNCRVSEVLQARWSNYYDNKYLILHGCKRSGHIVIRDRGLLARLSVHPHLHPDLIFPSVSYYSVYYHIKKFYSQTFDQKVGRKNKAVTHYYRYAAVADLKVGEDATAVLHHRSSRSALYYNKNLTLKKYVIIFLLLPCCLLSHCSILNYIY